MKCDVNKIKIDLTTRMHAMERKLDKCMSVSREGLQTEIGNLCAGKAELEDRLDKQQKDINSGRTKDSRPAGRYRSHMTRHGGQIGSGGNTNQTFWGQRPRGLHIYIEATKI
jgi:hypothetical protein